MTNKQYYRRYERVLVVCISICQTGEHELYRSLHEMGHDISESGGERPVDDSI